MSIVIVPDYLHDKINAALDSALQNVPDAAKDRPSLYRQLLGYYNEHGEIPEFSIKKKETE